jgi:hypothetical protein
MEQLQYSLFLLFEHIKNNNKNTELIFSINEIYKKFNIVFKNFDTKIIYNDYLSTLNYNNVNELVIKIKNQKYNEIKDRLIQYPEHILLLYECFNYNQIWNYIKSISITLNYPIFNPLYISSFVYGNCMVCMTSLINNSVDYVCSNIHCNQYVSDYLDLILNYCNKYFINDLSKIIMSYNNLYYPFSINSKLELEESYNTFWSYMFHKNF